MVIPTELIGSIPRPVSLIEAIASRDGDDPTTNRETAFEKIHAQVLDTALAANELGGD